MAAATSFVLGCDLDLGARPDGDGASNGGTGATDAAGTGASASGPTGGGGGATPATSSSTTDAASTGTTGGGGAGGMEDCATTGVGGADANCTNEQGEYTPCPEGTLCKAGCCEVVAPPLECVAAIDISSGHKVCWNGCGGIAARMGGQGRLALQVEANTLQRGQPYLLEVSNFAHGTYGCLGADDTGAGNCGTPHGFWIAESSHFFLRGDDPGGATWIRAYMDGRTSCGAYPFLE